METSYRHLKLTIVLIILFTVIVYFYYPIASIPILILGSLLIFFGLFEIPNNPITIGIVTYLGKKQFHLILEEGWNWLFLRGIIFDYLLLKNHSRERKINCQDIFTPDKQDLKLKIGLAYSLDKKNIESYLKKDPSPSKKEKGDLNIDHEAIDGAIQESLESRIGDVLRQWAMHPNYGPHTWEEAIASSLVAMNNIAKSLFGAHLRGIRSDLPTSILIQYFSGEKKPSNKYSEDEYGYDGAHPWGKLKKMLEEQHPNYDLDVSNRLDAIKERILERIEILRKLQSGDADLKISDLGIVISRLNIEEMLPNTENEVYKASLKEETERREKASETTELETEIELAEKLIKKRPDLNFKECLDYIKDYKLIKEGRGTIYKLPAGIEALLKSLIK